MPRTSFGTANIQRFTFQISEQMLIIHHYSQHKQKALYKPTDHLALYKSDLTLEITLRGEETVTVVKDSMSYFVPRRCGLILSLWVLFFLRAIRFCLKVDDIIVIEQHAMYQQRRQLQSPMFPSSSHWRVSLQQL